MTGAIRFESIHKGGHTAMAAIASAPAALFAGVHLGWAGFALLGAFVAGRTYNHSKQIKSRKKWAQDVSVVAEQISELDTHIQSIDTKFAALRNMTGEANPEYQALLRQTSDLKNSYASLQLIGQTEYKELQKSLQILADTLSRRIGMAPMPVEVKQNRKLCHTDMASIIIDPDFARGLTEGELAFVIAHELDHVRNHTDIITNILPEYALKGLGVIFTLHAGGIVSGFPVEPFNSIGSLTLAFTGCALSVMAARYKLIYARERRADSNALRTTDNKWAAISALTKVHVKGYETMDISSNSILDKTLRAFNDAISGYGFLETRIRNIEETWNTMQQELPREEFSPVAP